MSAAGILLFDFNMLPLFTLYGLALCPCVYVNRLAAIVLRSGDEPELELGDEIIMVNDEVTIGSYVF